MKVSEHTSTCAWKGGGGEPPFGTGSRGSGWVVVRGCANPTYIAFDVRFLLVGMAHAMPALPAGVVRAPSLARTLSPVVIADHRTSITLEDAFWDQLKAIAARNGESLNALVTRIDAERTGNLSSALRIFVLEALSPKA